MWQVSWLADYRATRLPDLELVISDVWALLLAHSCGGSYGFGPSWVRLTVFPFHSALFYNSQNHEGNSKPSKAVLVITYYNLYNMKQPNSQCLFGASYAPASTIVNVNF